MILPIEKIEAVIEQMREVAIGFEAEDVYSRQDVRNACITLKLDDEFQNKIQTELIKNSVRIRHGYYKYMGEKTKIVKNTSLVESKSIEPKVAFAVIPPSVNPINMTNQNSAAVPKLEPGYVPFGTYKNTEKIIASRKFFPLYITGPTGNGKSSMIINICAKNNIPMLRINCSVQSDEEKLIGSKTLEDGNIKVVEGPILMAMRTGALVVLEECDALDTRLALVLQGICEGRAYFFPLTGEYITPAPGFNIVGIGNTKGMGNEDGKYLGTNLQNTAFLERFGCTFEQKYPSPSEEQKMVINWMTANNCVDKELAAALVKWTDTVRRTYTDGGIEDVISTRRLNHIVVAFSIYKDIQVAIQLCTNRFDSFTSTAFCDLFDKIYVVKEETKPTVTV